MPELRPPPASLARLVLLAAMAAAWSCGARAASAPRPARQVSEDQGEAASGADLGQESSPPEASGSGAVARFGDWRADWAVADSFRLEIDTEGYRFPTAIAFVPHPGPHPDDPLYYVTELRGEIKVVSNDRKVRTFASDLVRSRPEKELPSERGETGLAGICLDEAHGYLFASYVQEDSTGILRNRLTRFATRPRTFALAPSGRKDLDAMLGRYEAAISHQIGGCRVDGDLLYVGVGDAYQTFPANRLDSPLGKVLRFTLDGEPAPGNPFEPGRGALDPAAYIYAYGFRNPFSVEIVNHRLFVVDNGPAIDRFLEVHEGAGYLWNGTDWSIGTNAAAVFPIPLGPVQMAYMPAAGTRATETAGAEAAETSGAGTRATETSGARTSAADASLARDSTEALHETGPAPPAGFPDRWRDRFFVALSGHPGRPAFGPREPIKGVLTLAYDLAADRMREPPRHFVKFRGHGYQSVVGLALGPDGLYLAPLYPVRGGTSAVLKVVYDPSHEHPFVLSRDADALSVIRERGCLGCHSLTAEPPVKGSRATRGPSLDRTGLANRVLSRVSSPEYARQVSRVDSLELDPYRSWTGVRHAILSAKGDSRARLWIAAHIEQPRFDDPRARMPELGVSPREARLIAEYLVRQPRLRERIPPLMAKLFPKPGYGDLVTAFGAGFALALVLSVIVLALRSRSRRRGAR